MNEQMFGEFLLYAMILCVAMGLLTPLFRWKKFGKAALPLAGSFFAMAILLHGLSASWPTVWIGVVALVLVLLLAADALLRSDSRPRP